MWRPTKIIVLSNVFVPGLKLSQTTVRYLIIIIIIISITFVLLLLIIWQSRAMLYVIN